MKYADAIISFNQGLKINETLPSGVGVLNPFQNPEAAKLSAKFYQKYYADKQPRRIILGINPGRLGGGLTGVPFTDPIRLETKCGIENDFVRKAELSSEFIYHMIDAFGGPSLFYSQYYFSSVSPLGFIKDGKNLNYYDIPELQETLMKFILQSLRAQLNWGIDRSKAFCLDEGDNFKFLNVLNKQHQFFQEIVPLPHPRFVMQYKRKLLRTYVEGYCQKLKC